MKKHLEKGKRQRGRRFNTLYASELGYCARKIYYSITQPKETQIEALEHFEVGNLIHDHSTKIIRNMMENSKGHHIANIRSEEPIMIYIPDGDVRISGRFDELVEFDDGSRLLIEKKSIAKFDYLVGDRLPKHHLIQAMLYMKALGADACQMVYFMKNKFKTKTFMIEFRQGIFDAAVRKAKDINEHLKEKKIPEAEVKIIGKKNPDVLWECNFCPYAQECDKIGLEAKKDEKT